MVKEYLKTIEAKIAEIPGMPKPMEEEAADGYIESPFSKEIAMVEVPKRFSTPNMTMYDGTTDPDEHVSLYKKKMITSSIPRDIREAIMCKGFGATLSGMVNLFKVQFASSRKIEKQSSDLYRVVQRHGESLRDYLNRFNRENIGIYKCDAPTTIEAFRRGLLDHSELYKELTKYPCTPLKMCKPKLWLKSDLRKMRTQEKTPNPDRQSRRNNNFPIRDHRFKPYQRSRFDEGSVNAVEEEFSDRREDPKGYLKELLSDKSKASGRERESKQGGPPPPPPIIKTICFISGGSEVCGLTYSAAKRHAKESNKDQSDKRKKSKIDIPIMFEESDVVEGHHDGLVISLPVGNCMIKRILVDNGSSTNIIMLDTLKHMNIDEKNIVKKSTMLVGFSRETKKISGEITLATYGKGINLQVKFLVVDTLSSYNMILGRPWIHEMKAIPSTYHQVIKFPTRWVFKKSVEILGS
ncbi:uncharacterized protein LOC110719055 [Chenopodium quinoa]|uniref:uncharacterized protein LOC110719055 n=1 Tax=Chenopodium quinoa TaxID=63459 RepID=UPI000B77D77D|nr:uncharacterized protein LOC110719055 [Chenopodium quinoa]